MGQPPTLLKPWAYVTPSLWKRVKVLVWIRGWGVPSLTLINLSIAGKILRMIKISAKGKIALVFYGQNWE